MGVPVDRAPARVEESERRLSPAEVEAVLGRAIELHVRSSAHRDGELSEAELLRIGDELGLPPHTLRQALTEVDGGIGLEHGWLARHLGAARAGASRIVERRAGSVQAEIERYLLETECMVVERRFPERTVYVAASGVLASATRATRRLAGRHPLLQADRLEVSVQELDAGSCCVAVTVDLAQKRRDVAVTGVIGGGTVTAAAAAAGVILAPPVALVGILGIPAVVAILYGSRSAYRGTLAETTARLESLLDRLEHGELRRGPALRALLGL
jgi:hypothetical protein